MELQLKSKGFWQTYRVEAHCAGVHITTNLQFFLHVPVDDATRRAIEKVTYIADDEGIPWDSFNFTIILYAT